MRKSFTRAKRVKKGEKMIFGLFKKKKAVPNEKLKKIGAITHYFPKVKAGVIKLSATLAVGDTIYIKGHTTDFKQKVASLQIDNAPIEKAAKGKEVGIKVKGRVRAEDEVYRPLL